MKILQGDIHIIDLQTRLPFRYGIVTMTRTPHAFLRLQVEIDGQAWTGISADSLPPKWFTKDPNRPIADEIREMIAVIQSALRLACGMVGDTPFDVWFPLYRAQELWGYANHLPALLSQFGTSLVERAMIEAFCRARNLTVAQAVRSNALGIRVGEVCPHLRDQSPAKLLAMQSVSHSIHVRQTVGLVDPLEDADVPPAEQLNDGLPQSLTGNVRAYGLHYFKIKVQGDLERDAERLCRLAQVLDAVVDGDYEFTLDGNEQFRSLGQFQDYWRRLEEKPALREFWSRLLFVEQPFHRDVALDQQVMGGLAGWIDRPDLIIDESDGDLGSLSQALGLGYAGTSHKNCKGLFKGILNACELGYRSAQCPELTSILSGEDLVNIGPVALLQDLAVQATLGVRHVERNGHHYFKGLAMFPKEVQRQILSKHGDLYRESPQGWPTLTIQDGKLELGSILAAPFGVGFELDVTAFTPVGKYIPGEPVA